MKITVLAENTSSSADIGCEHGLSLFVETGAHKILFDMGQTALFAENAAKLISVVLTNRPTLYRLNSVSSLRIIGNANTRCRPAKASGSANTVSSCEAMLLRISGFVMPTFCMISKRFASS